MSEQDDLERYNEKVAARFPYEGDAERKQLLDLIEIARDSVAALALHAHHAAVEAGEAWDHDPWQQGYAAGKSRQSALFNTQLSAIANLLTARMP